MASEEPVGVLVTGAAGRFELVHMFAGGSMLGAYQPVILHLHDIPSAAEVLNGLKKKLVDGDFPLLEDVVATTDIVEACTGVNIAVVHTGFSREKGTEAKDFMSIYMSLALALKKHAAANCRVWDFGDPADTNELFSESSIPAKNISFFPRLDHYLEYLERLNFLDSGVGTAMIWRDHQSTLYPDVSTATVKTPNGEKSVHEIVADGAWMDEEFINKSIKCSSAMSAASPAFDHIRWSFGTSEETLVSMGEDSDGSHSVPAGPNGTWSIVEDLGTPPSPAISQSEDEGNIRQMKEDIEMILNQLKELENREGTALHHHSSRIDEFDRHADRAFQNVCNKIEFLEREIANLQSNLAIARVRIANLQSNLAIARVYLHGAFEEITMWRQLYWN